MTNTYSNPDPLVTTDWLGDHLDDDDIAIVEVDEDTSAYATGHIPGAVSVNWETELHDAPRREFVSGDQLADLLGSKGVSSNKTVIFYGGNNNWFAAYAYWLCRYRGIDKVKLLDGGRTKWELENRALTVDNPPVRSAQFERGLDRPELRVFRDEVEAIARTGSAKLIDVRSPGEYRGEVMAPPHLPQEQPYVPGHVPGAANVPWSRAANEDGSFKSVEELRSIYGDAGVSADDEVVAYCRIGERSSHTWFVLSELLGFPHVRNYDGSWTEYGSLVGVPVATQVAA